MTVRCRRNVALLTPAEKRQFRDAVFRLREQGRYQPYVSFHGFVSTLGHEGPAFFPWHRAFLKSFEDDLRSVNPALSLPYWDFTSANVDGGASLIWNNDLFGGNGTVNLTWTGADGNPKSWTINRRAFNVASAPVTAQSVTNALNETTYHASGGQQGFRARLEFSAHGAAHVWLGGDQGSFGSAVNDPFFLLLHANVDRLWTQWQERRRQAWMAANPGLPYPGGQPALDYFYDGLTAATTWTTPANRHNLDNAMWPWDGSEAQPGNPASSFPPWDAGMPITYTPRMTLKSDAFAGSIYNTDLPAVSLSTPAISFVDIPAGDTTARAVVFAVTSCQPVHFSVIAGPGAPFGLPLGATAASEGLSADQHARIWVSYTGTNPGDSASGSITVRCQETGEERTVPITANTVARKTAAAVLVLDQSGSMDFDAGNGKTRVQVLRPAASAFVDVLRDADAVGIVSFDHDAYDVMAVTNAGPLNFGLGRVTAKSGIAGHTPNPAGSTSIGDGVELGRTRLPATGFDVTALVVLTDGQENTPRYIADVSPGFINERVFAIGLGTAEQINPVALTRLTNNTGGYLLMTGLLSQSDFFRLSKYYLQILAGITNAQIVLDPDGALAPGQEQRIPFQICETESGADVILLTPAPWAVQLAVETPNGDLIDQSAVAGIPGMSFALGDEIAFYRMTLPLAVGPGAHDGVWHAVLRLDEGAFKEFLQSVEDPRLRRYYATHGLPYSVTVQAQSSLRLSALIAQSNQDPGADLYLRATLTEFDELPVSGRADILAEVRFPDGTVQPVKLAETGPGLFEEKVNAPLPGIYPIRFLASGVTLRGCPFTREQLLTGAVWRGGDKDPPTGEDPIGEEPVPDKDRGQPPRPDPRRGLGGGLRDAEALRALLARPGARDTLLQLSRILSRAPD